MSKYTLGKFSLKNLQGVHPDLIKIIRHAINKSHIDFRVIEGVRSEERQRQMVINGHSLTLDSRHLTGHAVDIAPLINNKIPWDDFSIFEDLAEIIKKAANDLDIPIIWGGDWSKIKDGPHFELPRQSYK